MEKYLFVGGKYDGKRIPTDGSKCWRLYSCQPVSVHLGDDYNKDVAIEAELYQQIRIGGIEKAHIVYVVYGTTPDEALDKLIMNYNPEL